MSGVSKIQQEMNEHVSKIFDKKFKEEQNNIFKQIVERLRQDPELSLKVSENELDRIVEQAVIYWHRLCLSRFRKYFFEE